MTLQLNKLMTERYEMVNCGKKFADVGDKQKRKLAHFQSAAERAIWFAESFGLSV